MSDPREDPELTAWALGEASQPRDADASERARVEQAAALCRDMLRATELPGLDAARRVEILRRAEQRSRRVRPWLVAAWLAPAAVAAALYLGVVVPAEQRVRLAEQTRVLAELEAKQAEAREQAQQRELERARALAEAERAMHESAMKGAAARPTVADAIRDERSPIAHPRTLRPASKPGASSGSGGCDPNDPLCGL
jgi:hypothetical protein